MNVGRASRVARLGGVAVALAVPGAAAIRTRRATSVPLSPAGRMLLIAHVLPRAVLEESLWRGPLTGSTHRTRRAAVSVAGFTALHVRRDGIATVPIHLALAAAWTASALLGRTILWNCLSHAAYNYVAITGRPR